MRPGRLSVAASLLALSCTSGPGADAGAGLTDHAMPSESGAPTDVPNDIEEGNRDAAVIDVIARDVARDVSISDVVAEDVRRDAATDAPVDAASASPQAVVREGPCALWTRMPPAYDYVPLAADADGVWAAASRGDVLMNLRDGRWTMVVAPGGSPRVGAGGRILAMDGGAVWINPGDAIYQRRDGRWADIGDPRIMRGELLAPWSSGAELFGFVSAAGPQPGFTPMRFDGSRWEALATLGGAPSSLRTAFGDRDALYAVQGDGLWRLRGGTWTGLSTPRPGAVLMVGGPSSSDVYAAGDGLYHIEGDGVRSLSPPEGCVGTPAYRQLASAPGRLALVARCGTEDRLWNLVEGRFVPVGPLPALDGRVAVQRDGRMWLTASAGQLWVYESGRWTSLETQPAPPLGPIIGDDITNLLIAGRGLWRLSTDHWQVIPGTEDMDLRGAWRSPDGAVFFGVQRAMAFELWRLVGAQLRRDRTFDATSNGAVITGRAATEVYAFAQGVDTIQHLHRWNGTVWTAAPDPCTGLESMTLVTSGATRLLALGVRGTTRRIRELEGGIWREVSVGGAEPFTPAAFGPAAMPTAYLIHALGAPMGFQRTETGWAPVMFPVGPIFGPGPEVTRLAGFIDTGYGRIGATGPRVRTWFTEFLHPWTDLRVILGVTQVPFSRSTRVPAASALFRCDLGT